ncbi:phosphatidate cytidylyltransferase [Microbacterium ginsengiterrae]|uniref:Phosphatidate cytidylyltransferase n=1 Tax=Microbacterium ginsengiterrae TaxID=546115 RepID=A0A7W9FCL7_9MICO|nr:phosphatidate cytidylyltransferase [Microbacterium ginsengiterrae]MBB5744310.1 phosphatidate cytidylyltransferase [Microbacterium ginsengiterrae]
MSDPIGDAEGQPLRRRGARDSATPNGADPIPVPPVDPAAVPPRPPLPRPAAAPAPHQSVPVSAAAMREQLRQARGDFASNVTQAREHLDQANERIKARTGRDLILATLVGLAFGAVLLGSLLFFKELFVPIALGIAVLGIFELSRALRAAGRRIDLVPQVGVGVLLVLAGYFAPAWLSWVTLLFAVVFVIVWRLVAQMFAKDGRTYGDVLTDAVVGGFVQIYVPFLTSLALMLLRQEGGQWWVLAFIAVAVASDTGAYTAGVAIGKHPMAPRISPKKTWEGFGGAVIAAGAAGVLLALYMLEMPWWAGVVFGLAILLSATLGDLGESMIKRDIGIKDMSSWLPGHGGLLDRLDSILPSTVPALSLYFLLSPWAVLT